MQCDIVRAHTMRVRDLIARQPDRLKERKKESLQYGEVELRCGLRPSGRDTGTFGNFLVRLELAIAQCHNLMTIQP